MNFLIRLLDGIKLWFILSLMLPTAFTLLYMTFHVILGVPSKHNFSDTMYIIWIKYYFNGNFIDLIAWRIHLFIMFWTCLLSVTKEKDKTIDISKYDT